MIAIFEKEILLNALIPAMYTVSGKNTMPSIEGVHLNCTEDNKCIIQSYDLEKGMRTSIDCEVEKEGSCIINAQKLLQIVKTMPSGPIKISVDSSYKTVIESGLSHFDIKCLPGTEFPVLPELNGDRGFTFPQHLFRKYINKVLFAIGQNDTRPVFNGAYFEINEEKIVVVSCDGNRLAYLENDMSIENKNIDGTRLNLRFIIPGKTLVEVLKLVKDSEEEMEIRLTRKYVIFMLGKFTLFSKTIDSEYIDYTRILPKTHNLEISLKAEDLRGALERSSLIIEDRLAGSIRSYVKFTIDEALSVSTQSANGNVYDEIDINKISGDSITIGFNCKFLLDALKACDDGEMKLSFNNPLMGVLIEPKDSDDGRYKYFVMPIRMNN
ncbi:MAG: DNA polymerase III subunit beta [Ruminococcaceae bacterium]|nr:DNA polymerase III subunit beta [Oscillospiraceae bacterium]